MNVLKCCGGVALTMLVGCGGAGIGSSDHATRRPPSEDRDPRILVERGRAFAEIGDDDRAEQYFAAALGSGASDQEVIPDLLRVCVRLRHFRLGAEYGEAAVARSPRNARLRFLTGALYSNIGEHERARGHLVLAGKMLAQNADAQFAIAVFFRDELADPVNADPYFRSYLAAAPAGAHAEEATASLLQSVSAVSGGTVAPQ